MTPKRQHIAAILALASLIVPTWAATAAGASHDHAPSAPSTPPPATADDTKKGLLQVWLTSHLWGVALRKDGCHAEEVPAGVQA